MAGVLQQDQTSCIIQRRKVVVSVCDFYMSNRIGAPSVAGDAPYSIWNNSEVSYFFVVMMYS